MHCPVIELTKQLISCRSISPDDAGCMVILMSRLSHLGFKIEKMDFNTTSNFWAWHGPREGDTFVFAGHTDVVPSGKLQDWITPPFVANIRDGMLFGRGAADMKGALAAMIVATERFITSYPNHKGRLAYLVTSDEESKATDGTIKVIETLLSRNENFHYCLIGEPSSNYILGDTIKYGRRGSLTADLTIHGIQGHVAYPHLADNPIHRIIPMLSDILKIEWDHGNQFFSPTNLQITNLQTSNPVNNIIPAKVGAQFNWRFGNEINDECIRQHTEMLLKSYNLNYTINWQLSGRPFLTKSGKLIDIVVNVVKKITGLQPNLSTNGGTSDGRFIKLICSQLVELGLVNLSIHKINEYVRIEDLQRLSIIYQNIITKLLV
ncbi:MAG: succinyl-diaminopimelate desuccinylase [Candidatus Dasytiphilus stammeri]